MSRRFQYGESAWFLSRGMREQIEGVQQAWHVSPLTEEMHLRQDAVYARGLPEAISHSVARRILAAGQYEMNAPIAFQGTKQRLKELWLAFGRAQTRDHAHQKSIG
jgi:hypothetical protein